MSTGLMFVNPLGQQTNPAETMGLRDMTEGVVVRFPQRIVEVRRVTTTE